MPNAELSAFENPTTEFVEDFKGVLHEYNVAMQDINTVAEAYDQLRNIKRQTRHRNQETEDRKMFAYFEKNFQMLIRKMKSAHS